jgi:hypothetical protein
VRLAENRFRYGAIAMPVALITGITGQDGADLAQFPHALG